MSVKTYYSLECDECATELPGCYDSEADAEADGESTGWHVTRGHLCPECAEEAKAEDIAEESAERDADDRRHGV